MSASIPSRVIVDGKSVAVASVKGSPLVFGLNSPPKFVLPRWIDDKDTTTCYSCCAAFTLLRRRHHCRACGKTFCDKCCKLEMPLPQYDYVACERVCCLCAPTADLLAKAASSLPYVRFQAAKGLTQLAKDASALPLFLEQGGLQGLAYLAADSNFQMRSAVMDGLVALCAHDQLLEPLADAGCIKAVCSIVNGNLLDESITFSSLAMLTAFCQQRELKRRAVAEGAMTTICCQLRQGSRRALLAVSALSLLAEDPGVHTSIIRDPIMLTALLSLIVCNDEQTQCYAFRVLANVAATSEEHGLLILQNDFTNGQNIIKTFQSGTDDMELMRFAVALIGNVAFYMQNQEPLLIYIGHVFDILSHHSRTAELVIEAARTIANFCRCKSSASVLVARLPQIINQCLRIEVDAVRYQGLRAILHLVSHSAPEVVAGLTADGFGDLIGNLFRTPGMVDAMQKVADTFAPGLAVTLTKSATE